MISLLIMGAVNNHPINYFDNYGTKDGTTPVTLGFILYSKEEMLRIEWEMIKDPIDVNLVMVNTGSTLYGKNVNRIIFLNCGKIDVMSFNLIYQKNRNVKIFSKKNKLKIIYMTCILNLNSFQH